MSVPNFYKQFKKYMNMTPVEYKNHISIRYAMRLLKGNNNSTIEEISDMLGFESATYFRRLFKKYTGKFPREYRKIKIEM